MLAQTGLEDRADEEVGRLSGGNQQRVNIAIGLLCEPPVLLLDEPSASLDPRQRERLWEFIGGLAGHGTTIVFSTHNVAEAEHYASRVLVLGDGELLFTGTPAELERAVDEPARATSRPRSFASCASAATEPRDALAARQGPPDPQALAAARRAAGRLPDRDRVDDRVRAVEPPGQAEGRAAQRGADRARPDQLRQPADQHLQVRQPAVPVDRADQGQLARGGDREGAQRPGARRR